MALLVVATVDRAGNGLTRLLVTAAPGGDTFPNTGAEFLIIRNANATLSRTITFVTEKTVDGLDVGDLTVLIAGGASGVEHLVGPFSKDVYNDSNEEIAMTYTDSAADLTLQVFKLSAT